MNKYATTCVVLLSGLILTGSAIAQDLRMTNQTIQAMVRGGVLVAITTEAIRTAPQVSLNANKQESEELVQAGASDSDAALIMKAIDLRKGQGGLEQGGPRARRGEDLIVPDSTPVRLRLARSLSSAHARTDDKIHFEVLEDVVLKTRSGNRFLVIERGASASGTITDANPTRMGRAGNVELTVDFVTLANGDKIALTATEEGKRNGHAGGIVTLMAPAAFVYSPKDPVWLFNGGKESTIKEGLDITAATVGVANLDSFYFDQR